MTKVNETEIWNKTASQIVTETRCISNYLIHSNKHKLILLIKEKVPVPGAAIEKSKKLMLGAVHLFYTTYNPISYVCDTKSVR